MKAFLLTAAACIAFAGSSLAQNLPPDYYWEVGLNGGKSVITRPLGPAEAYQGTRTNPVYDYSFHLNYFLGPNWMLSLDIGDRKWETFGTWQQNDLFGQKLKTREVSFLIADHAINQSVGINYVIPFYTRYQTFIRSNLYFGLNFGLVETVNDGSTGYSKYNEAPDSNYTYVSSYNYSFGIGYSTGLQIGYTYYIIPRLALNLELGARYANMSTNDMNYRADNSKYYLLHFPQTVGIRWRF
jgi:hypothetical protein